MFSDAANHIGNLQQSAVKVAIVFLSRLMAFFPAFSFSFFLSFVTVAIYNQFLFCVFSVLHFIGKPLQANSWDDESTGSSSWQPLSLSFRHFSLAELSFREVGAYLEEKRVVSLTVQRDDPPLEEGSGFWAPVGSLVI